ncbi:MAG: hypothetical protein EA381_20330 [Planctomycetaceae bacterium]|nr:MAG: hypothetical protein EA381_20330 [Planctomycetaceae bacterium]
MLIGLDGRGRAASGQSPDTGEFIESGSSWDPIVVIAPSIDESSESEMLTQPEVKLDEFEVLKTLLEKQQEQFDNLSASVERAESVARVGYGGDGFEFETDDGNFSLAIQNRLQLRYATPFDSDPRLLSDLDRNENSFMARRARTRFRGHAYYPWLGYYLQYDWVDPILRDFNISISKYKWASVDIGRQKVVFNDERKTSSGRQQFVNRSIVNDIFTVDRQQGIQLYGNLFPGMPVDATYYLGVFTGLGVGERSNDDDHLMYNVRWQWNALGGEMPFSQSDIEFHEHPALSFAFAANTNRSRCLAYATSDDSCLPLPWAPYGTLGLPGQYRINQMMGEVRFKWQGFSLLSELHLKEIIDTLAAQGDPFRDTEMVGGFIQAGYFPHYVLPVVPRKLEFSGRYAFVDPKLATGNIEQQEISGVATYFISGHNNKINFQVSHLTLVPEGAPGDSEQRYWLQWDISF